MPKHVYDFAEGSRDMVDLLGGEGANLAEMTGLGLPVPPGFTITTEACHAYLTTGVPPTGLATEVSEHLHTLERVTGRKLGQVDQPLLVAVGPGPGTGTILNIGLTDDSVAGLAAWSGNERLAWDSYRRLVRVFGTTVLGIDPAHFPDEDGDDPRALTARCKDVVRERTGQEFPQDPREQLDLAVTAMFESWHTGHRRAERPGTAVNVCAMVFGSAAGVAYTRDPSTGRPGVRVPDAQGHRQRLSDILRTLEAHYRDLCEIEFTVERDTLWLLRAHVAERSAAAAFRVADTLLEEGLIDADEALRRVTGAQLAELMRPRPAAEDLQGAVDRILTHADRRARLSVRANADTPEDARRARVLGATGVGMCRTEHMFLGDRRTLVERLVLAEDDIARDVALAALLPLLRDDFSRLLAEMAGQPVTIRLLDPPPHEFLPDRTELTTRVAVARAVGRPDVRRERLLRAVDRRHEQNPALGTRGARLAVVLPGLYDLQVRAIAEAAATLLRAGGRPQVEIMIPLVTDARELTAVVTRARRVVAEVALEYGTAIPHEIGAMIEVPRAALTAGRLAESAHFFSFGTNDLTQTTWSVSRDDTMVVPAYLERGVLPVSPFTTIDRDGVGQLIAHAVVEGRAARPDLTLGVCGDHAGDPASIHFFHDMGLDYISCSPVRVPVARLEAGRAAVGATGSGPMP